MAILYTDKYRYEIQEQRSTGTVYRHIPDYFEHCYHCSDCHVQKSSLWLYKYRIIQIC
jgi:hypothetical protein